MRFDPVRMIEACYAPPAGDEAWLQGLLDAAAPLELGMGAEAAVFTVREGRMQHHAVRSRTMGDDQSAQSARFWERQADPALVRALFPPHRTVALWSGIARRLPLDLQASAPPRTFGAAVDSLAVVALDADGRGVMVATPSANPIRLPARTKQHLARVSAHLLSASRLRARSGAPGPEAEGIDAVLDPDGKVQHAVNGARDAPVRTSLAAAVQRVERARGRLRLTDPEEALSLWTGLVDGQWSLVDHCEADGRRYVLARRNEPGARDPRALAPRERDVLAYALLGHSNKYVAYLLGISSSTVASHLSSAMAKLGMRTRRDLLAALAR